METQAVVFESVGTVRVRPVEIPPLGPKDVLVRVEQSAVSNGTEMACLRGMRPDAPFPCVPGYQSIGRIAAVGSEVRRRKVGERVLMGVTRLGERINHGCGSAHVAWAVNSESWVIPLPKGVPAASAAFAWVACCGLQGFTMARTRKGDQVLVVGLGLIGQFAVQVAKMMGARVVAADPIPLRRTIAGRLGIRRVVDPAGETLSEVAHRETHGGFDMVMDTTGRSELIPDLIELLQPFGRMVLQGWYHEPVQFSFHRAHMKHLCLYCPCSWQGEKTGLRDVLRLMGEKKLRARPLITHRVPFTRAPEMYRRILKGEPDVLGILFDWRKAPNAAGASGDTG